jgi:hypothetical protein
VLIVGIQCQHLQLPECWLPWPVIGLIFCLRIPPPACQIVGESAIVPPENDSVDCAWGTFPTHRILKDCP